MSTTIDFIEGAEGRLSRRQRRHPWELWADGRAHELERGVDFDQELEAFRNRFYTKAKSLGKRAITAHVLHAVDGPAAERLQKSSRVKVVALDLLIKASDGDRRAVLRDRRSRLKEAGEEVAEILQVQFIDA